MESLQHTSRQEGAQGECQAQHLHHESDERLYQVCGCQHEQQNAFRNYYWLEGPLPGDSGRCITVLYKGHGQPQQCSHCLRDSFSGFLGGGKGKLCESLRTPRGKMSVYMDSLRLQDNYVSLKTKYLEQEGPNEMCFFCKALK